MKINAYHSGIEEKIIETINSAHNSIHIAMAWFTNERIKKALINKAKYNKNIFIKIVIDNNKINEKYFLNSKSQFQDVGIHLFNAKKKMLHNKFLLADNNIVVTGSYNFSNKANRNSENIVVIESSRLFNNYLKIFKSLSDDNYIDENITILLNNIEFARKIISTYYNFDKNEFKKYENKIVLGDCFTYDSGYGDKVSYSPGLLFNKSIKHKKINSENIFEQNYLSDEFGIPANIKNVESWETSTSLHSFLEYYRNLDENDDLDDFIDRKIAQSEELIRKKFTRKIDYCYTYQELDELAKSDIDILIENEIWKINFEPFITKPLIEEIFNSMEPLNSISQIY